MSAYAHQKSARTHILCEYACAFMWTIDLERERTEGRERDRARANTLTKIYTLFLFFFCSDKAELLKTWHLTAHLVFASMNIHCLWYRSASECIPYTAVYIIVCLLCENDGRCATKQKSSIELNTAVHA